MSIDWTHRRHAGNGSSWSLEPVGTEDGAADFFSSVHWAEALSSLGARCWYGTGSRQRERLFVFRRGPLRVGFPGFPVTPLDFEGLSAGLPERIDLLRANHSCLDAVAGRGIAGRSMLLPESVIPVLSEWPQRNARKLAKDRSYSRRQQVRLQPAEPDDAAGIFDIYRSTVSRHGGALRYSLGYFQRLLAIGGTFPSVCMRVAKSTVDDGLAGFCIATRDRGRGYYLHGGVDMRFRSLGVSDLLLDEAIAWSRGAGCTEFTMMASPPEQSGLVSFKRKWSERDDYWTTIDTGLTLAGKLLVGAMGLRQGRRQ